jgi:Zn-finger nucleic acid-binding protein
LPGAALHEAVVCAFCATTSMPAPESAPAPAASGVHLATEHATRSAFLCPRCDLALYQGRTAAVTLLGCGECGGIWLDNTNAQRAVASIDAQVLELATRASSHARHEVDRSPPVRCAECRATLRRVKTTRLAVEVDVCAEHGTWFDRDELRVVLEAMTVVRAPARPATDPYAPLNPAEIPDFRASQPVDFAAAGLVAGGIFTVLGALVAGAKS